MKMLSKSFTLLFLLLLINCKDDNENSNLSIALNKPKISLNDYLKLSINNPKNLKINSVNYYFNKKTISSNQALKDVPLGKNNIMAIVNFNENLKDTLFAEIEVFYNKTPKIYSFEILNTYPHDITSYTQGLEFYKGALYESTGQYKASKLRKVDYKTGKVIKNINLSDAYFGEGITIVNDKIYQLTWENEIGFVYDVNSFEKIHTFSYSNSKEGWGLCNDGKKLYKTDGTEKIWKLDLENLKEKGYIQVYTKSGKIPSLNELEWIDGLIYANIYGRDGVAIINPTNGAVEGVIDFKSLRQKVTQHEKLDVLNGIAYHPERKTLFVTGKNWDKLFEVKILMN